MQISRVQIDNLKSIKHITVDFDRFTPLIGVNNAGKSTVIRAIEIFFDPAPKITRNDHYNRDDSEKILITISFTELTPGETKAFQNSIVDGSLTITREVSATDRHGSYAIYRYAHPAFQEFQSEQSKSERRKIYSNLREEFTELHPAANADECAANLEAYEKAHLNELQVFRMKGFLGAVNIANGQIKKKSNLVVVPAVKDGADLESERTSPVVSLLNTITTQTLENKKDLQSYLDEARDTITTLADPASEPRLQSIGEDITGILSKYYGDARVDASWDNSDIVQINYPRATISVNHRGIDLPISSLGHGLQRILIFSILQYLAKSQSIQEENVVDDEIEEFSEPLSDIILAVEEPEIYQHPIKQRQIYSNLRELSEEFDKATGIRVQIIFTTHSEKMVSLSDFGSLRLLRKIESDEGFGTDCAKCSIEDCSAELAGMLDPPKEPLSGEKFLASLHIFTDEVSEGFFAEKIILVEGVSDKAVLEAVYLQRDRNPNDDGIAIIRADGKTKLDKPALIFKKYGIPVYTVFDSDKKGVDNNANINRLLQKISGSTNICDFPDGANDTFCSLKGNLESYMRACLGENAKDIYNEVSQYWGIGGSDVRKSPSVVAGIFSISAQKGIKFPVFDQIVNRVDSM